ncbi:hypothetical protein EW026_g8398, partial [Hermanssonia centrifuga]
GIELQEVRASLLAEASVGAASDVSAKSLEEMVKAFHTRVESWHVCEAAHLIPLVEDATGNLDAATQNAALELIVDARRSEDEDDDWMTGEASKVSVKSSDVVIGSKRKREEMASQDDLQPPRHRSPIWHEINDIRIDLPSSHHKSIRTHEALVEAVTVEKRLQEGQATELLDNLRSHLITSYGLVKKRLDVKGQGLSTRAQAHANRKYKAIRLAATAYRCTRAALLKLGMPEDHVSFKALQREDVRAFTVMTAEQELGDSKKAPSWIWENLEFVNTQGEGKVKEYFEDAICVHWFRSSALRSRWDEEQRLLLEEMARTVRFFMYYEQKWKREAVGHDKTGMVGYAAYAQRQSYRMIYNETIHDVTRFI